MVTVSGTVTAGGLTFDTSGYTLTGGTLALTGATPTITTNAGVSATISSAITGSLVKSGAGTLTFSGAQTYTGATIVDAGRLVLSNVTGFVSATTVNSAAALAFTGNTNVSSAAPITLNDGATLENTNTGATVLSGAVTSTGNTSITVNHTGAAGAGLILDGGLKGSGTVTINAVNAGNAVKLRNNNSAFSGTLIVNGIASAAAGAGSGLALGGPATSNVLINTNVVLNGTIELADRGMGSGFLTSRFNLGALSGTGIIVGNRATNGNFGSTVVLGNTNDSGVFSGRIMRGSGVTNVVGVTKVGTGTQVLSGDNTYTGATRLEGGVLSVSNIANGGVISNIGASSNAAANLVFNGGTLQYTGAAASTNRQFTLGTSGGTIDASGSGALNFANTAAIVFSGAGARSLTLTGSNTDANTLAAALGDSGGASSLTKAGAGMWVLTAANSYSGSTTVSAGTLRAGATNTFSALSATTTLAGGTFDLAGFDQTVASLDNAGAVNLGGAPGTTLTVTGNYVGNGGTLNVNTALGGDASPTDRLVVNGNTSGSSSLRVTNVGGLGAPTTEGIKVVDVGGASNGTFSLLGDYVLFGQQAVVGGAYAYTLQKNGLATPGDGDWYLRSSLVPLPPATPADAALTPLYQPGVPLYEALPQVLLGLNGLSTMRQRIGNRHDGAGEAFNAAFASFDARADAQEPEAQGPEVQARWGRMEGWKTHVEPRRTGSSMSQYDTDYARMQAGLDGLLRESDVGRLMASVYLQYGTASSSVRSFFGDGTIKVEGYALAATLTWLGDNGFYVDAQAQGTYFNSTLHSTLVGRDVAKDNGTMGYALGVESGWRVPVGGAWSLTPQAQLVYSTVDFSFVDTFGAAVSLNSGDSLSGRGGIAAEYQSAWIDPSRGLISTSVYGIANLYYEFLDGTQTNVAGVSFANAADRLWGGLGGGGSYAWANGRYALYAEALVTTSLDNFSDSYGYKGTTGFRMRW